MNAPQFIKCEQNSREWFRARMGIPTASSFSDVLAKGEGKTRRAYLLKLAGEIITGEPMENFVNANTDRGHAMEAEARDLYAFQTGAQLDRVGFVRNGRVGCSPDSLIGEDGGVEIKTTFPHLLIDLILKDEFPAAHKAQVQGALWVTGRQWWDIVVYWPNMPMFVKRAYRDEAFIQTLATEIDRFNTDLDAVVVQMRRRIEGELPDFSQAKIAPSPELLASRLVVEAIKPAIDTTTVSADGVPAFLDRRSQTVTAEPSAFDEAKWLADLTKAFGDCIDFVTFAQQQQTVMLPARAQVTEKTWKKATRLMSNAIARLTEETSGTFAVAAE